MRGRNRKFIVGILAIITLVIVVLTSVPGEDRRKLKLDTLLISAVEDGDLIAVKRLIQSGADPNARRQLDRSQPQRLFDPVSFVLELLGKRSRQSDTGPSALQLACQDGSELIVTALVESGADVNATGVDRKTPVLVAEKCPLSIATILGYPRIVDILLKHGANVNQRDRAGQTPLMHCILFNLGLSELNDLHQPRAIRPLSIAVIWNRAERASRDRQGTANNATDPELIAGLRSDYRSIARSLILHGANPSVKDNTGTSAIDYARASGDHSEASWLKSYEGPKSDLTDMHR